ncbi:MAG: response regulator [Victivallaceae bacterium]|nr:response regulator [Victivallaceae bacterium]
MIQFLKNFWEPILNGGAETALTILSLLLLGMSGLVILLLIRTERQRRFIRRGAVLMNLSVLDCFLLGKDGRFLIPPQRQDYWPRENNRAVPPEQWLVPEDVPMFRSEIRNLTSGRSRGISVVYRVAFRGRIRSFHLRAFVGDGLNSRGGFAGTIQDVTQLLQRERNAQENDRLLLMILEQMPCPAFVKEVGKEHRYLAVNSAFLSRVNLPPESVRGKTDFELICDPDEAARFFADDLSAIAGHGKLFCGEANFHNVRGEVFHDHTLKKAVTMADGRTVLLGLGMEAASTTEAQKLRQECRYMIEEIMEYAPCGIVVRDARTGSVITENEYLREKICCRPGKIPGKICRDFLSPEMAEAVEIDDSLLCHTPGREMVADHKFSLSNGLRHFRFYKKLLREQTPNPLIMSIIIDLTEEEKAVPAPPVVSAQRARLKVLIVDDVEVNGEVLRTALFHAGVSDVVCCRSGEEALELLKSYPADCVFADLWMPGMNGDQLAELISSDPQLRHIPVVAVTGDVHASKLRCFRDIIYKPVNASRAEALLDRLFPPADRRSRAWSKKIHFRGKGAVNV